MALATLLHLGDAIRSVDSQTTPYQPVKTRWVEYLNPTTGVQEGHQLQVFLYNATGGALTQYATYMVDYDGDEETNPKVIAAATATPPRDIVVAQEATATASWGWFACVGYTQCGVEGTTDVAKDDYLKLTSGTSAVAFIKDGSSYTTSSHAIATEAQTTNSVVNIKVYLLGGEHLVA